jgi:hypothetical protein
VTTALLFPCVVRPFIGREVPGSFQLVAVGARFGSSSTAHAVISQHNLCVLASYVAGYSRRPCVLGAIKYIRSPDRPARRQSLYRLRYPAHSISYVMCNNRKCSIHYCQ